LFIGTSGIVKRKRKGIKTNGRKGVQLLTLEIKKKLNQKSLKAKFNVHKTLTSS
jgi:hypothetical protein